MPYIPKNEREHYLLKECPLTPGELNFALTRACLDYLSHQPKRYETFNTIIGAFECAKQEFYRRVVVPYEQRKCDENGDVYP